jgi:hypothetical protein
LAVGLDLGGQPFGLAGVGEGCVAFVEPAQRVAAPSVGVGAVQEQER